MAGSQSERVNVLWLQEDHRLGRGFKHSSDSRKFKLKVWAGLVPSAQPLPKLLGGPQSLALLAGRRSPSVSAPCISLSPCLLL